MYAVTHPRPAVGYAATSPSPLRHASTASSTSSNCSDFYPPSRSSTISSDEVQDFQEREFRYPYSRPQAYTALDLPTAESEHRGRREAISTWNSDKQSGRQQLSQSPHVLPTVPPSTTNNRMEMGHSDHTLANQSPERPQRMGEQPLQDGADQTLGLQTLTVNFVPSSNSMGTMTRADSVRKSRQNNEGPRAVHFSASTLPSDKDDLNTFRSSTTGHLRTLSQLARKSSTADDNLVITSPEQEVAGMHGRRRFQCAKPERNKPMSGGVGYAGRTWMDTQRQYLQAYEYLCHIGEAKEWIEDIVQQQIPAIVHLEEALRNGVTLAEVVQALNPDRTYRIFRHDRLQFRHSDNIAIFFNFLAQVELPELFRFELVDLYEKKNIPKVIYCIHALSWLLFRKGIVDFRIGNLVGQLQFEDHELEAMQKGLDKSGVSMPNFGDMTAALGGETQEPLETESQRIERERREEDERIERELYENESSIMDLQSQARGAILRLRLGDEMQELWDYEHLIVDLQARIRADFSRQVSDYRLEMRRFAVSLQSAARAFIARNRERDRRFFVEQYLPAVVTAQRIWRGRVARADTRQVLVDIKHHDHGIRQLQSAIRGVQTRRTANTQKRAIHTETSKIQQLQSIIRAGLQRKETTRMFMEFQDQESNIHCLQSVARGMLLRHSIETLTKALRSESQNITKMQSRARGFLCRETITKLRLDLDKAYSSTIAAQSAFRGHSRRQQTFEQLCELSQQTDTVLLVQSHCRAMMLRTDVADLLEALTHHTSSILELQAFMRGVQVRQRFKEKMEFYHQNMKNVIKIQSFVRAKQQGEAYRTLTSGANPPVGTIKNFVHLLNDSDFDFDEELEFERLRKTVVHHVRQNELAEQYIDQLDIKIALLVKNKITLDEVIKHQKHFGGHVGNLLTNKDLSSKDPFDLKALNKNSRKKLEHYQELFFLLQTQPQYLARLFRKIRDHAMTDKESNRVELLMMTMFGFAQKRREEYYLLRLVSRAIKVEVQSSTDLQEYLRGSHFWSRVFNRYIRSPRDRKYLRDLLGPLIKENIVENEGLDLESDPMQIYRSLINNEELRTGQRSARNPDIAREDAIRDPDTRETFIQHLSDLRDIADHFFLCLEETLHKVPYGVRYVASQTFQTLCQHFPHEPQQHLLGVVGNWVWKTYICPALLSPDTWGVVDRGLSPLHKRNLMEVAKVLGQVSLGRPFGPDNVYLRPLDNWISDTMHRMEVIWTDLINIQDIEKQFDIDEFNDLYSRTKPTLYIKLADIFAIHQLVTTDLSALCNGHDDPLQEIVRELGSAKNNESELMGVGSSEISLQLNPKYLDLEDPDAAVKALFMETKRCVLYIIRIQAGANLLDVMIKPILSEDEDKWTQLVREELSAQRKSPKKRSAYDSESSHSHVDVSTMTYTELKRTALENILTLQKTGRISPHNQYQDLLNSIAIDIRTKHRRRQQRTKELEGVRATLTNLDEKAAWLDQQLKSYNDYIEQAMITLQNKKGKKRFLLPFTKQYNHERELQRTGRVPKFGSFKYSARNLADKGVLVSWKGYHERQWDRINVTISSDEIGLFHIEGSMSSMMIPGASATVPLDDLLQAQFNNCQFINLFGEEATDERIAREGTLRLNVNLLVHLLMRKFYRDE